MRRRKKWILKCRELVYTWDIDVRDIREVHACMQRFIDYVFHYNYYYYYYPLFFVLF